LGFAVAGAGHVNGDGADDVLVGAHGFSGGLPGQGRVYLYLGEAKATAVPAAPNSLSLAAPSPFPAHGRLLYSLPQWGSVRLVIFDARGRRVHELVDRLQSEGDHVVTWNGRDFTGRPAASGLYFARLRFGGEDRVTKFVLLGSEN
jgi:hypothetical protein